MSPKIELKVIYQESYHQYYPLMKCQVRLVKDLDTKNKHRGRWRSFNRFLVVTEILADSPAQIYKAPYSGSQQGRLNRFQRMRLTSLLRCRGEIQLFFV